jgi:hypothetical protein
MMSSTNVLILNVFNVYQEQSRWSGRLSEEQHGQTRVSAAFEDVIDLSPRDGVWKAACDEQLILDESHSPCVAPCEALTYNSRGAFTSMPTITGARINLIV